MTNEEFKVRLAELHKNPPPTMDWMNHVNDPKTELTEDDKIALDTYFRKFCRPDGTCPGCRRELPNMMIEAMIGESIGKTRLEWGLVHGEAFCVTCRYPYRGLHYNIGPFDRIQLFLAYHPSGLSYD